VRYRLGKLPPIVVVVGLTFVKVFPFSSQFFGALGALAFGAGARDGRLQLWFRPSQSWPRTLSALTFSAVHYYQGWAGLISNFAAGVLLGALYVLRSRTLPSNVIAHALADSLGLVAIYLDVVA